MSRFTRCGRSPERRRFRQAAISVPAFRARQPLVGGRRSISVRVSDFLGRMIENLLYSRAFGATGLGAYTFANQAPRFICEAASGPVWAALYAFALRENPERSARTRSVRLLSSLVFPVAALLSATSPGDFVLVLGRCTEAGGLRACWFRSTRWGSWARRAARRNSPGGAARCISGSR